MGRQHTTWISDETWDRLQNIAGDSVSKKISNAVKFADPDEMMRHNSLMRQYAQAKNVLRAIAKIIDDPIKETEFEILEILEDYDWIWSADMEMIE